MAINIKDLETEKLIREVAELTGEGITETVRIALEDKKKSLAREEAIEADIEAIRKIAEHCSSLPIIDNRSPDEILGYDEFGVPS